MGAGVQMLVPMVLEDVHGQFLVITDLARKVAADETLCACAKDLLDRRAVLRRGRVDLAERSVFEKLTRRNASPFILELRRRISVELTNDSARILAVCVAFALRPPAPSAKTSAPVVIDLASRREARGK